MNSLKTKLSVFQGLAGLGGIIGIILIAWLVSRQRALSNAITNAENLSEQIAYSISIITAQGGDATFNYQRLIEKNATLTDVHTIKVMDENGVILADNHRVQIGQTLASPLIESVRLSFRKEQLIDDRMLIVVRPLHGETYTTNLNDVVGFLWVELDLTPAYARAQEDVLWILAVSLGGFLLVFFWYYQVTQYGILNRLSVLSDGLQSAANGNLDNRISTNKLFGSTDEINDLSDQFNQMIASLRRKLSQEEFISRLSANFATISYGKINEAMDDTLQILGEFFNVDRAYIFEFNEHRDAMDNTHEWCLHTIVPQKDNLQGVPTELVPWWMEFLYAGRAIVVPRVSELPTEAISERSILEEQGIQSVLVMPMITADTGLFGFLGFDSVKQERDWTNDEVNLLTMLTSIITNAIIRYRSQQDTADQRDFAMQVMNTVRQGLTVTDSQGLFMYVNPAYARLLRRESGELIGRSPIEFTDPAGCKTQEEEWKKRLTGTSSSYSSQLCTPDGGIVHVLIGATPWMRDGQVIGSIASVTDLTEQLQAEERLRKSEARNQAFLSAVPDLIFRIDLHGNFLDYKAGDNSTLYVPTERIIGGNVKDILPEKVVEMTMSAIRASLETSIPQAFEYKLSTDTGTFTFEARVVASGQDEVIAVVHDITERARFEQMKTDFINRASHELRTPLTTALLMVDLLDENFETHNGQDKYWQILKQELNRERVILEDVLTMGRIESDKYAIADSLVKLQPILNNAINAMLPQADLRKIEFQAAIPASLPQIRGSEEAFTRIFNNVVSNAVKFSKPGGVVYVSVQEDESRLSIQIRDEGIGIPPEDLPYITSRFFRATNATEQEIPGSGIGLYMIKNITERLGGTMSIQSLLNKGTTLHLRFPIPAAETG